MAVVVVASMRSCPGPHDDEVIARELFVPAIHSFIASPPNETDASHGSRIDEDGCSEGENAGYKLSKGVWMDDTMWLQK